MIENESRKKSVVIYCKDDTSASGLRLIYGLLNNAPYRIAIVPDIKEIITDPPKPNEAIILLDFGPGNASEADQIIRFYNLFSDSLMAWYDKKNLHDWPLILLNFIDPGQSIVHFYDENSPGAADHKDAIAYC